VCAVWSTLVVLSRCIWLHYSVCSALCDPSITCGLWCILNCTGVDGWLLWWVRHHITRQAISAGALVTSNAMGLASDRYLGFCTVRVKYLSRRITIIMINASRTRNRSSSSERAHCWSSVLLRSQQCTRCHLSSPTIRSLSALDEGQRWHCALSFLYPRVSCSPNFGVRAVHFLSSGCTTSKGVWLDLPIRSFGTLMIIAGQW